MEKADLALPSFEFPTFGKEEAVTGAAVGSALHELMQRIPLTTIPTMESLAMVLQEVNAAQLSRSESTLRRSWPSSRLTWANFCSRRQTRFIVKHPLPCSKRIQLVVRTLWSGGS